MKFRIDVAEGSGLPNRFYGHSYMDWGYGEKITYAVYYLVPLNYLFKWLHNLSSWWLFKRTAMSHFDTRIYHMVKMARATGFKIGYEQGRKISEQQADGIKNFLKKLVEERSKQADGNASTKPELPI